MYNELQKKVMKKVLLRTFLLLSILIVLLLIFSSSFIKLFQGPKDLYSLTSAELPGAFVKADIAVIVDTFAEYYEEDRFSHIILGYNAQLEQQYKKDFESFLNNSKQKAETKNSI